MDQGVRVTDEGLMVRVDPEAGFLIPQGHGTKENLRGGVLCVTVLANLFEVNPAKGLIVQV
jgi:hypothetical protein